MTESVDAPAYTRWLPGQTVMFTTHHTRSNPLDLSENAPDITGVSFLLGPSSNVDEALIHVELDRIQTAPRFRQMDGAGLALFDASASSVVCTMNTCSIDWAFTSTWLLDDVDDLHVLTTATDDEGLAAGPEVFVRKTAFNEVENDLEVWSSRSRTANSGALTIGPIPSGRSTLMKMSPVSLRTGSNGRHCQPVGEAGEV